MRTTTRQGISRLGIWIGVWLLASLALGGMGWIAAARPQVVSAQGSAVRDNGGFNSFTVPANDDGFVGPVPIGFTINFYGVVRDTGFVNNNGNMTFDQGLSVFTPFDLDSTQRQIIAAFFGDVDTRPAASRDVTFGNDTIDGRPAFGVNYLDVGCYDQITSVINSFQLILIERSDRAVNDFDIEFNYNQIQWETGTASGGNSDCRGGNSARVGFSNGAGASFELPGSALNGAFLDGGGASLTGRSFNSGVLGRYRFEVRNGQIDVTSFPTLLPGTGTPTSTPLPTATPLPPTYYLCENLSTNSAGALTSSTGLNNAGSADGARGSVYCRIIAQGSAYITKSQEIGISSVIELGVVGAVDLFGLTDGGSSVIPFIAPMRVCVRGANGIVFLGAENAGRVPFLLDKLADSEAGYACASIPNAGTVVGVLSQTSGIGDGVGGTPRPTATPLPRVPAWAQPLSGCTAVALENVRIRLQPSFGGVPLTIIPGGTTVTVNARVDAWYRVLYNGVQGWTFANYLQTFGACG